MGNRSERVLLCIFWPLRELVNYTCYAVVKGLAGHRDSFQPAGPVLFNSDTHGPLDGRLRGQMMRQRKGFTIVELFVVVLLLGIIAVVVAPKLIEPANVASDNALGSTLRFIRDTVGKYISGNEELPGISDNNEATAKADLSPSRHGDFSKGTVEPAKNDQR